MWEVVMEFHDTQRPSQSVAVIVAVRRKTSTAFQALTNGSLCAQDLCKLMVNRELMYDLNLWIGVSLNQ